jgi:NAD+ kinase
MNVAIYGRKVNKLNIPDIIQFLALIKGLGWNPILEKEYKDQLVKKINLSEKTDEFSSFTDFKKGVDLAISIGGDGAFIKCVGYIRDSQVPIMGINMGRLGFLANTSKELMPQALNLIQKKEYVFQKRSLIRIETEAHLFGEDNVALNEVTVHKKDTSSMITVRASLDGNYLNSYWADGLIVATPTGSTAYNLSCGGPIITPGCQVHILTPIAPHNLNVRPMVVPDHLPIELSVDGRDRRYLLSLDGFSKSIRQGEEVMIRKAEYLINVIKFEENNFLDTIRNKMQWGIDPRN